MRRSNNQKNLLAIVMFLAALISSAEVLAQGRACADLFQNDLLFQGEARVARLNQKVDDASYAAATILAEAVLPRMEDPASFVRMVQDHIVKTFEANVQLMFEQRRDLFDFFVDPVSPVTAANMAELLAATSRIYSVKVEGEDLFHVASQDKNAFFEVANRLKQSRRALH